MERPHAALRSVSMTSKIGPQHFDIEITTIGRRFHATMRAPSAFSRTVEALTDGAVFTTTPMPNSTVEIGIYLNVLSYGEAVERLRAMYGTNFALGPPRYWYDVPGSPSEVEVVIDDSVPGNHRYITLETGRVYLAEYVRRIEQAESTVGVRLHEEPVIIAGAHIHLVLTEGVAADYLTGYELIASLHPCAIG